MPNYRAVAVKPNANAFSLYSIDYSEVTDFWDRLKDLVNTGYLITVSIY